MMGNVNVDGDPDIPAKINLDLAQFLLMNQEKMRNPGTRRYEIMITYPNKIELEPGNNPQISITEAGVNFVRVTFKKRDEND